MTTFPNNLQACLLFSKSNAVDLAAVTRSFLDSELREGKNYNLVEANPGLFYRLYGIDNDLMVTIERLETQANLALFEPTLASPFTQIVLPDARQRLARHRSHVLIGVHHGVMPPMPEFADFLKELNMPQAGHSLLEFRQRLKVCGQIARLAHAAGNADTVHWTRSDHLWRGDMFAALADTEAPTLLHIHPLLFNGGTSADGRQQVVIKTLGVAHFIGREIHVLPTPLGWGYVMDGISAFVRLATIENGYVIPDGDTFGPQDHSYSYRVRHIAQGQKSGDFDGPVYQLELLHAPAHGITSPDYIPPKYTFDDRNVPRGIMRGLGEQGFSFVHDLRDRRRMAERAGGTFQVKSTHPTDRPAPERKGLLARILPFGKRN